MNKKRLKMKLLEKLILNPLREARILVSLFIFIIIILSLIFSKIRTEIINFKFDSTSKKHVNSDYKIIIKLCVFNKIPIIKTTLTQDKLENLKVNQKAKDMAIKAIKNKNDINTKSLIAIKKINIIIKTIKLRINIGTENAGFTAIIVGMISTIIPIILRNTVKDYKNQTFAINPIYINQNIINIALSGIFELKMIHIINIIYILNKKEGVKKYERASDRRSYAYSYE